MPSREPLTIWDDSLRIEVEPDFWLRRITRWPFYFQNWSPRFRVKVTVLRASRALDNSWPAEAAQNSLRLRVRTPDDSTYDDVLTFPALGVGKSATAVTDPVVTHIPGVTQIQFFRGLNGDATLYAYHVYPEERVWIAFLGPLGSVAGFLLGLFVK